MFFYERIALREIKEFQELSKEEKKEDLYLFKHKYFATWLTYRLTTSTIPTLIALVLCIISMVLNNAFKGWGITLIVCFSIITAIAIDVFYIVIMVIAQKKDVEDIRASIKRKIRNIQLINFGVITFKNWMTIRKNDKELYSFIRSEGCNHLCYNTTYLIANALKDPEIKIIWMSIKPCMEEKCGHAALCRKNKIYDTNARKTYNREKYFKAFNAEIFKEYTIDQYLNNNDPYKVPGSEFLDWEEFGKWCEEKGAQRTEE